MEAPEGDKVALKSEVAMEAIKKDDDKAVKKETNTKTGQSLGDAKDAIVNDLETLVSTPDDPVGTAITVSTVVPPAGLPSSNRSFEEIAGSHALMPLPTGDSAPRAFRNTSGSQPGAYLDGRHLMRRISFGLLGSHHHEDSTDRTSATTTNAAATDATPYGASTSQGGEVLAQARCVAEDEETAHRLALPQATHYDMPEENSPRNKKWFERKEFLVCGAFLVLAVVVTAVITVMTLKSDDSDSAVPNMLNNSMDPTLSTTASPTKALLDLDLPESSWAAIRNPHSSRGKAYRWMENDPNFNSYSMSRRLQRFALAVVFYSTQEGGEGGLNDTTWTDAGGWMSYDIHECEWFSKGGLGFELFPNPEALVLRLQELFRTSLDCGRCALFDWMNTVFALGGANSTNCNDKDEYVRLYLYNNNLIGTIPSEVFTLLPAMVTWDLSNNPRLEGSIPSEIGLATNLKFFWHQLTNHDGTLPTELGRMTDLQVLRISETSITGTIPTELGQLSNLLYLFLRRNQLSGTIPTELSQLDQVSFFSLSLNALAGSLPTDFGLMSSLILAEAFGNQLEGSIPTEVGQLSLLQYLYLELNDISGSIPTEMGLATDLLSLHLQYNQQINGSLPSELGLLSQMRSFNATQTDLSGLIPSSLCTMQELLLDLDCSNGLCGCNCSSCT